MAFACTESDKRELRGFLARVLDAHKGERVTRERAVILMCHVMEAATADASTEFRTSIRLPLESYASDPQPA